MRVRDIDKYNKIKNAINDLFFDGGQPPSIRDIAKKLDMPISSLSRYLAWMKEENLINYDNGKYRGIKTPEMKKSQGDISRVPVIGSIACGTPALAEENIESYVTISTKLLGKGSFYFLKAHGDSMVNAGINAGDLVLVKKEQTATNGDIVVALTKDGETTLKRFYRDDKLKMIRLHPENDNMQDILVKECTIQGIAVKVIKDL